MSGTPSQDLKDGNRLEFVVRKDATRAEVKKAFEERFEVKVDRVNVKIMKDGKHAIIKLKEEYSEGGVLGRGDRHEDRHILRVMTWASNS